MENEEGVVKTQRELRPLIDQLIPLNVSRDDPQVQRMCEHMRIAVQLDVRLFAEEVQKLIDRDRGESRTPLNYR